MQVQTFLTGPIQTNCYVVSDGLCPDAMIVDPGGDADVIINYIEANGLQPRILLNTHAHIDHIGGNTDVQNRWPEIRLLIHKADADALDDPTRNLSSFMGHSYRSPEADVLLSEGEAVAVGACEFTVIHVPGHTPGGMCLYVEERQGSRHPILFAGDCLFAGGVGRGDFPGGNMALLIQSIRDKLLPLPPDTVVYPGHGDATTIGAEAAGNPFLL